VIAPTHFSFALLVGLLFGIAGVWDVMAMCLGAMLPDLDNKHSFIGKLLPFVSHHLYKLFGRRRMTHSLILWGPLAGVGVLLKSDMGWLIFLLAFGAITHCLLDCMNISGVQILFPVTTKIFAIGSSKQYRIQVASKSDFITLVICLTLSLVSIKVTQVGGMRAIVGYVVGSYDMAMQQYLKQGTKTGFLTGSLRFVNGTIRKGKYLIVGIERDGVAILVDDQIIHIPEDAEFNKCRFETGENNWKTLELSGIMKIKNDTECYFRTNERWFRAKKDDVVFGAVIYRDELNLETLTEF